jgi:hypothetical protein
MYSGMYQHPNIPVHQRPLLRLLLHVRAQENLETWDPLRGAWELFQAAPGPDAATCDHWERTIRQRYEDAGASDQLPPR